MSENLDERIEKMNPLQRAVFALKETQARLAALEKKQSEPIAIVGMSCRFPGGINDPEAYWKLLTDGGNIIKEVPSDRWDVDAFYDPDSSAEGKMNTRWGGFLDRIDEFDNHFFNISDREAQRLDPQQRLTLELAWEAFEDAGMPPSKLRGSRTGVFVGISHSEYGMMLSSDLSQADAYVGTGTAHCIVANRISFAYNFSGPSMVLDTACSSSLVATHLACQSLRNGDSETALAGGVSVILSPMGTVNLTKAGFSSNDGQVRAFDAAGSGYVRSEGAGFIVLKTLSAALKNGDPILAVIRGSAVNQNGYSNGLTAPSKLAQERVLRDAYAEAKVSPGDVQYVEAQGTGTPLGDAIEAMALGSVLKEDRPDGNRCAIGSVKTNIGHTEAASGIASLMKVVLAIKKKQLPPSINFNNPNPDIPFDQLPLQVQQSLEPWPDVDGDRIAGVSAFGFGGSNSHVVLTNVPESAADESVNPSEADARNVLPISARTEKALQDLAKNYLNFLETNQAESCWSDLCYSAAMCRDHHDCRLAIVAESCSEAAIILKAFLNGEKKPGLFVGRKPFGRDLKIAFLYEGQNSEWHSDHSRISKSIPSLSQEIQKADEILSKQTSWGLKSFQNDSKCRNDTSYTIPAAMALQIAYTAWWRSAGVAPNLVLGAGTGELAAACSAGSLSAEKTIQIATKYASGNRRQAFSSVELKNPSLPFLSSINGESQNGQKLDPVQWQKFIEKNESLESAIDRLRDRAIDAVIQLGQDVCVTDFQQNQLNNEKTNGSISSPHQKNSDQEGLLDSIGHLYAIGADLDWNLISPAEGTFISLPKYPWQRQSLWVDQLNWLIGAHNDQLNSNGEKSNGELPNKENFMKGRVSDQSDTNDIRIRPDMNTPFVEPQTPLEKTMATVWSEILRIDRVGIHDNFFELGGDSLQATIILNQLQEQLGEIIHVLVLFQSQTINDLAVYLREAYPDAVRRLFPDEPIIISDKATSKHPDTISNDEVELSRKIIDNMAPNLDLAPVSWPKNPRAVFIVSPPRSGTTLLRVMLAGHPGLFAPPELELLQFDSMASRDAAYPGDSKMLIDGGVRAVMDACRCDAEEAHALIKKYEVEGKSTQEFYRHLQASIGDRILVDKTPSYSGQLHVIQRAEEMFDKPLFIHLVRHPCAMIRSFVDYKLLQLMSFNQQADAGIESPFSSKQIAELIWVISNQNILQLLQEIPAERQHRLYFEELVRQPEESMRSLSDFIGIDYQAGMIQPYEDREKKMLDGSVAETRMQGDLKLVVQHSTIDPSVADEWKKHMGSDFLGTPARELASEIGYDDLQPMSAETAATEVTHEIESDALGVPITRQTDASQLLEQLDDLSDAEVATLLEEQLRIESSNG